MELVFQIVIANEIALESLRISSKGPNGITKTSTEKCQK